MGRHLLVTAASIGALALTATTAPAQAPPAAPPPPLPLPLSAERYAALDPVLKREVTLDARKPDRGRVKLAETACRRLPRTDPFVAAFRATCRADVAAVLHTIAITRCKGVRPCVLAIRRYSAAAGRQASSARALNRILPVEVTDEPCRNALRYRASELRTLDRLQRSAASLEKALRSQSQAQFQTALGRFFRVDRTKLQTHRARLSQFRIACR